MEQLSGRARASSDPGGRASIGVMPHNSRGPRDGTRMSLMTVERERLLEQLIDQNEDVREKRKEEEEMR